MAVAETADLEDGAAEEVDVEVVVAAAAEDEAAAAVEVGVSGRAGEMERGVTKPGELVPLDAADRAGEAESAGETDCERERD